MENNSAEEAERNFRACNLILYGLEEPKKINPRLPMEPDKQNVHVILRACGIPPTIRPFYVSRLGRRNPDRDRPLMISFLHPEQAEAVYKARSRLDEKYKLKRDRPLEERMYY